MQRLLEDRRRLLPALVFLTSISFGLSAVPFDSAGAGLGGLIEAGAPMEVDFDTWQTFDDQTSTGQDRWYCNVTLPVTGDGILEEWTMDIAFFGPDGQFAQMAVIRCSGGGGGGGPALSGCLRVGLSPIYSVGDTGPHSFDLAGSNQLDGAVPNAIGIVVRNGDFICADANDLSIGVDCNGSSVSGGCPGPDFDTQFQYDLDLIVQPLEMEDSSSDGVLMIKAHGRSGSIFSDGFESGDLTAWSNFP